MSTEEETCTCIPATDACSACRPDAHAQRDELADLIASVTIDTKSGDVLRVHPDGETPVFEGDQRTADAILAAGYRKPRTITTVEELDRLGRGSTIVEPGGCVWVNDGQSEDPWASFGEDPWGGPIWTDSSRITLPVTVIRETP